MTEASEISQKTVKRGSVGQGILGRVRDWSVWQRPVLGGGGGGGGN